MTQAECKPEAKTINNPICKVSPMLGPHIVLLGNKGNIVHKAPTLKGLGEGLVYATLSILCREVVSRIRTYNRVTNPF